MSGWEGMRATSLNLVLFLCMISILSFLYFSKNCVPSILECPSCMCVCVSEPLRSIAPRQSGAHSLFSLGFRLLFSAHYTLSHYTHAQGQDITKEGELCVFFRCIDNSLLIKNAWHTHTLTYTKKWKGQLWLCYKKKKLAFALCLNFCKYLIYSQTFERRKNTLQYPRIN